MKIYTKNLITDTTNLKQSCKKYEVDFLFITDEGFYRLYNDKYFKGRVIEGKHDTHMIQLSLIHI